MKVYSNKEFQAYRLKQIVIAVIVALIIVSAESYYHDNFFNGTVLAFTAVFLLSVPLLIKFDKGSLGATVLLTVITMLVCVLIWTENGIRDPAILAMPGILIFAAMVGSFRLLMFLLTVMILNSFAVTYAATNNILVINIKPITWEAGISVITILLVIAFTMYLMSKDMSDLLARLQNENQKVRDNQRHIEKLAHYDSLTDLANRVLAKQIFEQFKQQKLFSDMAFIVLDIDDFKSINDSLGHENGDTYLQVIAKRLNNLFTAPHLVARLGGDEFLVVYQYDGNVSELANKIQHCILDLAKSALINDIKIGSAVSVGVALTSNDDESFDELFKNADMAMYASKQQKRGGYSFFEAAMEQDALDNLNLITRIRTAIDQNQFELYYQPKVELNTQKIVGAEALIRWHDPQFGMIMPDKFITAAERSGLIVEIGKWVLQQACDHCHNWHRLGFERLDIAVNISSLQLKEKDFVDVVQKALEFNELHGKYLELELTESVLIDDADHLVNIIRQLHLMGVQFSIDDFGTGYSNLGYLKKFHIDHLKIDRSFVDNIVNDEQDMALVQAIMQMAHSLGAKVVAEGIESNEVAKILAQMDCELGQGYYWSKPVPNKEFISFLSQ